MFPPFPAAASLCLGPVVFCRMVSLPTDASPEACWLSVLTDPFELVPGKGPPAPSHGSRQNESEFSSEAKESFIL